MPEFMAATRLYGFL